MATDLNEPSVGWSVRPDLVIGTRSDDGRYVVKDPKKNSYFSIGDEEHFLLEQIRKRHSRPTICEAYQEEFKRPLPDSELQDFIDMGCEHGFLKRGSAEPATADAPKPEPRKKKRRKKKESTSWMPKNWLYFRFTVFNPDAHLSALEPWVRWLWTWEFLAASAMLILAGASIIFTSGKEWMSAFPSNWTIETTVYIWVTVLVVTLMHEFSHGLTCKHFGGEVREIGALFVFFTPCLYCNVSDAWLFAERWKRLLVAMVGIYWDLCVAAIAAIVWRVTLQDTFINYLAWMVGSTCIANCAFNLNPLIRLDGYYILSDWLAIPNLSDQGSEIWKKTMRWLLWGGKPPKFEDGSYFLLGYGIASWIFMLSFFGVMMFATLQLQGGKYGFISTIFTCIMFYMMTRTVVRGATGHEFFTMLRKRYLRTTIWAVALLGMIGLLWIPVPDRSSGTFNVHPKSRLEIHAPESGFMQHIELDEGSRVEAGTLIARLHIPDLESNITKKKAEVEEAAANVRRLIAGPRPEEVSELEKRVERSKEWRDLARRDLQRAQLAFDKEMLQIDHEIAQAEAECNFSQQSLRHAEMLYKKQALSGEQYMREQMKAKVASLELEKVKSDKASRQAIGASKAEAELAAREKELADTNGGLNLLKAGSRREDIEAGESRLARLREELKFLEETGSRLEIRSPFAGVIVTPHLHEKNGQFVEKGKPICVVEDLSKVVAEISVPEDYEHAIESGNEVELRPRALPHQTFATKVDRKAPSTTAVAGKPQGTVMVYCSIGDSDANVLSGMTGVARIYHGHQTLGMVIYDRVLRYFRTEFWW